MNTLTTYDLVILSKYKVLDFTVLKTLTAHLIQLFWQIEIFRFDQLVVLGSTWHSFLIALYTVARTTVYTSYFDILTDCNCVILTDRSFEQFAALKIVFKQHKDVYSIRKKCAKLELLTVWQYITKFNYLLCKFQFV